MGKSKGGLSATPSSAVIKPKLSLKPLREAMLKARSDLESLCSASNKSETNLVSQESVTDPNADPKVNATRASRMNLSQFSMTGGTKTAVVDSDEDLDLPPPLLYSIRLPKHPGLRDLHAVYRPSKAVKNLLSEKDRTIFAERFIDDHRLGTLEDLCAEVLAKGSKTIERIAVMNDDPMKLEMFYENLSVNLPIEECLNVDSDTYWRRVVQAKSSFFTDDGQGNWKERGMTLKLQEMVEATGPELWQSGPYIALAPLIKDYILELSLTRLRSMEKRTVIEYLETGDPDLVEEAVFDMSYIFSPRSYTGESDDESELSLEEFMEEEEEGPVDANVEISSSKESTPIASNPLPKTESAKAIGSRSRRKKKGKGKKQIKSIFDIPVSEDEPDIFEDIKDRRNLSQYLANEKTRYPVELSHHIDFRFLRFYDRLTKLCLEFRAIGPPDSIERYMWNVSTLDMEHLAYALHYLKQLKEFRLTCSRLNADKLLLIARVLKTLPQLEIVAFSHDQLGDDLSVVLRQLFKNPALRELDLAGNQFDYGNENLYQLAYLLRTFPGELEYLNLSFNSLGNSGFRTLTEAIVVTGHVSRLRLSAVQMSEEVFIECVARRLVGGHGNLLRLDVNSMTLSAEASNELVKALQSNRNLLELDCRGCDMPFQDEYDAYVLMQGNHYMKTHEKDLAEDDTKPREKHPLIVRAIASAERLKEIRMSLPEGFLNEQVSEEFVHPIKTLEWRQSFLNIQQAKRLTILDDMEEEETGIFDAPNLKAKTDPSIKFLSQMRY